MQHPWTKNCHRPQDGGMESSHLVALMAGRLAWGLPGGAGTSAAIEKRAVDVVHKCSNREVRM